VTRSAGRVRLALLALVAIVGVSSPAVADAPRDAQWHLRFLDVDRAHQLSQGANVVVAVVDSGVDGTHPDLAGNVTTGTETFVGNNGGNGWTDATGHGTRMAGLIAAHGHGVHNTDGALGIAPKATILPVRAGTIEPTAIGTSIRWATEHGARVISVSAGGEDQAHNTQAAVADAIAHDVVVVAGAGNKPEVSRVIYPAAYPGVVAVAGVDRNGNHAELSVAGREVVLSAPATDIVTSDLGRKYRPASGTSDATAIVAGAAALVRARFPNLSAVEVIHRLTATAIDKGPKGRDEQYGYGIVNLVGALTADVPPLPTSSSPTSGSSRPSASLRSGPAPGKRMSPWPGLLVVLGILVVVGIVGAASAMRRRRTG